MSRPWRELSTPEDIDVVDPDGTVRSRVPSYFSGKQFIVDDMTVDVRAGDEIRRTLPNGREQAFVVEDPKYFNGMFGPHYQISISPKGTFERHTGGNYISVTGTGARVNLNSTDNSVNLIDSSDVFKALSTALDQQIADVSERERVKHLIQEVEKARDRSSFKRGYQALITSAANHMTILAPFLPALAEVVAHLPS